MKILNIEKKKIIYFLNIFDILIDSNKIKSEIIIKKTPFETFFIYNKEIQLKIKIKNNFKYSCFINVNFKNFLNIIKNYPEKKLSLNFIKDKFLIIKSKNIKSKILISKNNYKKVVKNDFFIDIEINIKQNCLYNIINSIYFFIKKKNNNYFNNCIFLYISKKKIVFLINDNYRIVINKNYTKIDLKSEKIIIIQNKILLILKKILLNNEDFIKIKLNKKFIKFELNDIEIISGLTETILPKIRFKILKNYKNNFFINKNILKTSLKRSLIIKNNINFSIWTIYKNFLIIKSENSENNIIEKLKIDYDKKKLKILVNTEHILDLLKNLKYEKIQVNITKNLKYLIIKIPDLKNFKYIISSLNFN